MSDLDLETAVKARRAGASDAFLAVAGADTVDARRVRRKARRAQDGKPAMGGCLAALWAEDLAKAWRKADTAHLRAFRAADIDCPHPRTAVDSHESRELSPIGVSVRYCDCCHETIEVL